MMLPSCPKHLQLLWFLTKVVLQSSTSSKSFLHLTSIFVFCFGFWSVTLVTQCSSTLEKKRRKSGWGETKKSRKREVGEERRRKRKGGEEGRKKGRGEGGEGGEEERKKGRGEGGEEERKKEKR